VFGGVSDGEQSALGRDVGPGSGAGAEAALFIEACNQKRSLEPSTDHSISARAVSLTLSKGRPSGGTHPRRPLSLCREGQEALVGHCRVAEDGMLR
jgi:hypothetical protein